MALNLEKNAVGFLFLIFFTSVLIHLSTGAVHSVGGSAGWTTIGNVDYKQWAATKNFQVGDVIVFMYNPQFHNVMRVTHAGYKACNASSPISTHTTGNDTITIDSHGHHFFLCGVPGHCQAGQKVDINVLRATSIVPGPSDLVPEVEVPAPSPSDAAAQSTLCLKAWITIAIISHILS
ncbi:mavicyanin-like [Primulina huaijiensis]|uniref:mavicyanin-like n=1 Tax=Primulina huaijiensis TaxID=1492673 RepID=UPI003CC71DCE